MKILKNNIAVYQEGDSTSKTILFVHGFPYDHSMWGKQVNALSSSYFCVTYDVRGTGRSPAGDGQFTMESFVDDLEFIIDELKLDKPVLCGLSMGGYISLRAAERFESRLGGLILCDTRSGADGNEGKLKRAAGIKKINSNGVRQFVLDFIPDTFADESIKNLGKEYLKIVENSSAFDPVGVKGCLLAMACRTDTTDYLPKIKIPVLVLCGEKDNLSPPPVMRELAGKINNSEFFIIPNSGHMTPVENPAAVNKAIEKFLVKHF